MTLTQVQAESMRIFLSALPKNRNHFESRRDWLQYAHRCAVNSDNLSSRTKGYIKRALIGALAELNKVLLMCL